VKAAPLEDASPSLAFSADGRAILVGGHDGRVLSFEATTLKRGPKTPAMYDAVEAIALLGPVHFAAASTRGEGNVYETATMRLVYRAIGPGGIAATSDGSHLFLAIGNKVVCHETRNW
jgi:WD40 repeat protein